jgi:hypothetical protein
MLGRRNRQGRFFDRYVYENHIPWDHELVRIDREVDFSFVEDEVRDLYEEGFGRPSWPPEVLFRMLFFGVLFESTAVGNNAQATAEDAIAIGDDASASGVESVALGDDASASAQGGNCSGRGCVSH